jgi:6-phosphofructokinase
MTAGAEEILIPEAPISTDAVVAEIIENRAKGKGHNLVVVAEGIGLGVKAIEVAVNGPHKQMVALRGTEIVTAPIEDGIDSMKLVKADSEIVNAARAVGISFGDE